MNFFHTSISTRAVALAEETLRSTFVSEGRHVQQFESRLAEQLGLIRPVAVNSGTAALHLALAVAGVGAGDEVILPAQTFVATGMAILMQRATPVFADIQPRTGNLDAASVGRKITARTRAVIPVHWAGYPCDMDEINDLADAHGLAVVEDAAHALGATYHGRPVGALSRFTCFSFQATKHLTTGDGGALCCLQKQDFHEARRRRWFGIDRERDRPSILGERTFDLTEVGYKYHMNDLAAALGLGNLEDFAAGLLRRSKVAERYRSELSGTPGIQLLDYRDDRQTAWWLFTLLVDRREDFVRRLAERGVPASVVHQRIDRNTVFGGLRADLPGQAEFDARQVSLPVHSGLTDENVKHVCAAVRQGW